MWAEESVFYQIYPMGFTGAPYENDGVAQSRILQVLDWIPHMTKLGVNAIYFSPVFESDTHGYNTRDYTKIDTRLGSNEDFAKVVKSLHEAGIKVVIDGVFNHVGRGFWAFKDVQEKKWDSPYKDWFNISFDGNSNYDDGFWYEGWEGFYDLVKINLRHPDVKNMIFNAIQGWVDEFDIDGLRLDVAYMLDRDFLKELRYRTSQMKQDFYLIGETIHGDYNQIMNDEMLQSVTNYECYKGLYSSFNSMNMFEIVHSLLREFGPENWTLYKGKHLLSFVDNHDVSRVASILTNERHLKPIYTMLMGMPGIPCVYYGSEWGFKADKKDGDPALRPHFDNPEWNDLTDFISKLIEAKKHSKALNYGDFTSVCLTNPACVFERNCGDERVLVCVNAGDGDWFAGFDRGTNKALDLVTGEEVELNGGVNVPGCSGRLLKLL